MDTYFVKDADVVAFCLHPEKSHIYYLTEPNDINKQYIIEEDMLTFNIINKFEAIEETAKTNDPYGYNLYFYKKKQYLILTYPSSLITIWDTNSKTLLFKSHAFKKPLERITALALSESYPLMIFSARSQTRLFMTNINEAISSEAAVTFRKLKLSKKVTVNDIKCHPIEAKCAVACNDGVIRTWDLTGLNAMVPILETAGGIPAKRLASMKSIEILKLSLPSVLSVSFSPDGTKLLSCNQQGKILVWDVTNLGEEHTLLASIRLSEKGVLSGAWLNYNGDYRSTRLICYTQEGNIKSLELERNAEKRPDKKGVMWSLRELENIYHTKGEINPDRIDIDPYYQSFLKTHPFSNLVVVNTLKEKKFLKERMIQLKFSLNIKVLVIFDKLDYLLDYPKFAPNIHVPLNQVMFPPNQRSLTYQKEIFYVEDGTLNQLDLSTGKKEIVIEFLKTPQLSDVIRTTKFELRPITLDHVSHYTFLINFQKEKYQVLLIALYNAETNPVTFKLYKEIPCAMSLFLGNTYLHNPPVFILGEDRTTYMVFIDDPSKLDKETIEHINVEARIRDNLNIKIKKVYWTPFRHGYVLIYQTAYDNLLRFSMNRIQSNDILDFRVLTTDYVYKTQYDEDVFDVIWQAKTGYIEEEQYLGAVISWNKITVINENLQQMLTIKMPYFNIKTNMLVNAFWFGYTLFYYTKNHFFYSTLDGKSNCICSFDNYSYKNQILAMMNDRVIFGSKPNILNSKQARQPKYKMEIRFRPIVLNEPVILGYLSLKKIYPDFVPDYNIVKQNLQLIETPHLSTELIKGLNEHKLFNAAWFILGNQNYSQFSIEEKVKLLNKLGHFDQFFEILLPGKHLTDQGEANEVIRNILNNPVFYVEKNLLEKQAEVFINFGEFTKAVQSYDLLQEYQKISSLLSILGEDRWSQTFASNFLKENNSKIFNYNLRAALMIQAKMVHELMSLRMAVKTGTYIEKCEFKIRDQCSYGTQDFHLNDVKLIDNLKKTLPSHLAEEELPIFEKLKMKYRIEEDPMGDITKLNIPFGETPYSFVYTAPQAGEEDEEKVQPKFTEVFSTTPYQFLGYNCLEMDETKKKQGGAGDFEGAGMDEGMEDTDESGAISLYWRFDEGKGVAVENILGNNLSGTVEFKGGSDAAENVWVPLEDGDPMELEDKWGKKCPPQFAISFRSDLTSIKCSKKTWSPASLNRFTVELWLRPKSEHGVILEIGQGNFVFGFQNLEFVLQVKNSAISLTTENKEMANKEEGDDEGPAAEGGDEETNKIRNNFWNHVAIVYDNSQQKKLTLYLNCVLVKSSEFTLPSDLFKDQNLYLGKEKLNAELTEFRLWTSALSLSEIKEQHRMPLEIVFEKKKEIKVKFKASADKNATTGLPKPIGLPAPGMLPAPGGNTGLRPPPGSGFPAPEGFSFPAQKAGGIPMPESFATYKEETSPGPKPSSFGIPRPEEDASPVQRPASNSGFGIPRPDDVEPYQSRSISKFDEREEEEKRVSSGGFDDYSRPKAASGFSDFDTYGRDRESPSPNNFDQFGSHHHHEEKPASSFDNFGFQSTPAQQAPNNFGGFSDFNTAPVTTGGFGGFEKWDNNNNSTSPKPAAQANNFSDFSSFSQTQPQKEEAKSNFNDFGNFNSFDTANSRTPVQNDNNFSGFDSFSPKPADASRNRTSTEAHNRSSIEAARKSRGASEERIRRKSYEAGHHEDEMGDHHHHGENPEISFAHGINAGDITFQDDDYRKNLSRPKDADQKQLAFTDSLYSDLINAEGLDRDQLIKAKDVWVTILHHFQNAEINEAVEAIDQAISILKKQCTVCSKLGDKALLKKLQKLIVQLGRYRLGTQLLTGIKDMKNQESPSLRKLCYLLIVLYSLKLVYATNPVWLIETAELNLKAKNYKIAHQVYEDLLNSNYYELNDDQKEKIVERLKNLDELPRENNTLQKMNCPSCSQSFGFVGEYSCPECSKDFVLCYQTLSCIDEEGNLKCNACHACFSKTAKQIGERCSVCRMGALFAKK